jgi:hypothetical protein
MTELPASPIRHITSTSSSPSPSDAKGQVTKIIKGFEMLIKRKQSTARSESVVNLESEATGIGPQTPPPEDAGYIQHAKSMETQQSTPDVTDPRETDRERKLDHVTHPSQSKSPAGPSPLDPSPNPGSFVVEFGSGASELDEDLSASNLLDLLSYGGAELDLLLPYMKPEEVACDLQSSRHTSPPGLCPSGVL